MTEDSSLHCQSSLDTSHPKRPGAPVLSSFVFLDTTAVKLACLLPLLLRGHQLSECDDGSDDAASDRRLGRDLEEWRMV